MCQAQQPRQGTEAEALREQRRQRGGALFRAHTVPPDVALNGQVHNAPTRLATAVSVNGRLGGLSAADSSAQRLSPHKSHTVLPGKPHRPSQDCLQACLLCMALGRVLFLEVT